MVNVELATTQELIDELAKRHDAFVVSMVKYIDNKGNYACLRQWKGNNIVCLGLMDVLGHVIQSSELLNARPLDARDI